MRMANSIDGTVSSTKSRAASDTDMLFLLDLAKMPGNHASDLVSQGEDLLHSRMGARSSGPYAVLAWT